MSSKFTTLLIALGVGLCTLQSFYFPGIGSAITLIGMFILIACAFPVKKLDKGVVIYVALILVLLSIYALLNLGRQIALADLISTFAMLLMVGSLPLLYETFDRYSDLVVRAIRLVVLFHVFWIFVQVLFWVATREYLDILYILIGQESGSISKKGIMAFGSRVPRFSGLFNEPGTFCVVVMSLLIIYYAQIKKIDITVVFGAAASLATMSLFGIVMVSMLLVICLLNAKGRRVKSIGASVFLFLIFSLAGGTKALMDRLSPDSDYSGVDFREKMIEEMVSNSDAILYGYSLNGLPSYFVMNDNGLWFAFVVNFGVVGIALLLSMVGFVAVKARSFESVILLVVILMTKLKFTYPLFWLLLTLLALSGKNVDNKKT